MSNLDRKDLKIQALLEKVASLTQNYENQIADLRVELTISENNIRDLSDRIQIQEEPQPDVIVGEIVEDVPSPDGE